MYNLKSTQKSVRSLMYLVFAIPISFIFLVVLVWSFLQISGLTINIWGFTTFMYNNVETHHCSNCYKTLCLLEYASVIVVIALLKTLMVWHCVCSAVPLEMPVLVKENFNRWYSLRSYYLAITVSDIPFQVKFE